MAASLCQIRDLPGLPLWPSQRRGLQLGSHCRPDATRCGGTRGLFASSCLIRVRFRIAGGGKKVSLLQVDHRVRLVIRARAPDAARHPLQGTFLAQDNTVPPRSLVSVWTSIHLGDSLQPMLPRPHPAVVFRSVSDGAVLLHTEDEVYFGLNVVGSRVWQLLAPECTELDDLCARLAQGYPEVDPAVLRADVAELLDQLVESKLLVAAA